MQDWHVSMLEIDFFLNKGADRDNWLEEVATLATYVFVQTMFQ